MDMTMAYPLVPANLSLRGPPRSPDFQASPMTELSHCFTGLSAFQTGDTPRRCLDLSNMSSASVDDAAAQGSPQKTEQTDQSAFLPVVQDSPVPRNSRMKRLRSILPRLLCSSPKFPPSERPISNKENVAPGKMQQGKAKCSLLIPEPHLQSDCELGALGSPIYPTPPSPPNDSPGGKDADISMEMLENQDEGSVTVAMSSSMAQLLSDPFMNQEVNLTSVSVCRQAGRRLFRSPSMPERLDQPVLKRACSSPSANPPLKRHRTIPAIIEEGVLDDQDPRPGVGKERRHLLKKTLSLCEVERQLGGDSINAELIGDFSKVYALPTVPGRHQDLKYITGETMCAMLEGQFSCLVEAFVVVDCRYPYEYQGGHIQGALNLPNTDEAVQCLLAQCPRAPCPDKRLLLVLHCEFSSERAPRTCRLLRSVDRSKNEYPALHYPELYILKGGYRDFFHSHREHCEPQSYCPMNHEDHKEELLRCRTTSRASAEERRRQQHINRLGKL